MTYEELQEKLLDEGYDDVILLDNYDYADAFIGITADDRAVYDYGKMIDWLMNKEGWDYETAAEWIDYNTIRALPYAGAHAPIIVYSV